MDRSPCGWCPECSLQCGARASRAAAQQTASASTFVAGVDRRPIARRPERALAVVPAPIYGRTCLPLPQADPGLNYRAPAPPERSRSLDLAGGRRVLAALVG